jgi:hypothetical protein
MVRGAVMIADLKSNAFCALSQFVRHSLASRRMRNFN